jgi:hypothetical protein
MYIKAHSLPYLARIVEWKPEMMRLVVQDLMEKSIVASYPEK